MELIFCDVLRLFKLIIKNSYSRDNSTISTKDPIDIEACDLDVELRSD